MKALMISEYGGPEVMQVKDMPEPVASANDVLVEVHAASVNPIDWKIREGFLHSVFPVSFPRILGRDFSGIVRAVGSEVEDFKPGDPVYGVCGPLRDGPHAELLAVEAALVARKPKSLTHAEAAATGVSAITALASLDRDVTIKEGDRVLIHAGAGGVGFYAIQYAKSRGAFVISTSGPTNVEIVRKLGADQVIDYTKEDFSQALTDIDIAYDTVGGEVHANSYKVLKPGGTLVFINTGPLPQVAGRDDITVIDCKVPPGRGAMERVSELADAGVLKPWISESYRLEAATEAYALSQSGHARGKLVLNIR